MSEPFVNFCQKSTKSTPTGTSPQTVEKRCTFDVWTGKLELKGQGLLSTSGGALNLVLVALYGQPHADCNLVRQEEIIELQDIRLSPIPSIRNRFGGSKTLVG